MKQEVDIVDMIAGELKVSRGTAYELMREALEVNNKGVDALAEQPDYSICPACGGMASDPIVPVEALAEQAAEPATEADMAVYKAIADNYHASLPQAAEQPTFWYDLEDALLYEPDQDRPDGCIPLYTHPAPTQQDGTNGVVALQERLRQKPVALQPLTDDELRNVLRNTNHMIRNAMYGSFWPELEQACRAIEAAHGITSTNKGE